MQLPLNKKFAHLVNYERRAVLAWARSHDWGGSEPATWVAKGNLLRVTSLEHSEEKGWMSVDFYAETLKELRDWAGY